MSTEEAAGAGGAKPGRRVLGPVGEHLLPSGTVPGAEPSETVWTGCDGPPGGSWSDRRAKLAGLLSWLLVGFLAIWLHVTDFGGFVDSLPYVLGAKVLVFVWVLFGISLLRPLFTRRARESAPEEDVPRG